MSHASCRPWYEQPEFDPKIDTPLPYIPRKPLKDVDPRDRHRKGKSLRNGIIKSLMRKAPICSVCGRLLKNDYAFSDRPNLIHERGEFALGCGSCCGRERDDPPADGVPRKRLTVRQVFQITEESQQVLA